MKRDSLARLIAVAFVLAAVVYAGAFYGIEYLRARKGGWLVTFQSDVEGSPALVISQPKIGISTVTLTFPGQRIPATNLARTIVFDQPITNVPFGRVVYLDTTFLPGSVVFDLFGHEVQLRPRVLMVDRRETPWRSGATVEIAPKH